MRVARLALVTAVVAAGCASGDTSDASGDGPSQVLGQSVLPLRPASAPTEYTGFTASMAVDLTTFGDLASGLFGDAAAAGDFTENAKLSGGIRISAGAHPDASDQVVWTVTMDVTGEADPAVRTIARVPAGLDAGATFISAVEAALTRHAEVIADDPAGAEPFRLEYRTRSAKGGSVVLAVDVDDTRVAPVLLQLTADTPTTSLSPETLGSAAYDGSPYESIYGLVWFGVSRDNFDFFVNRAYGLSAGKAQNFTDFELIPHNWLRLTVTPQLDDDRVNVGFEVVTVEGDRVPIASAPASLVAGEQFMQNVFRMMDDAAAQEAVTPGSAAPWRAPFYYDDPEGGGIVEVIAQGEGSVAKIAYSIESPKRELAEVEFVAYQGSVEVPADWDAPPPSCEESGSESAANGYFDVEFVASSTVLGSNLKAPLRGTVHGSVYRSEDVKLTGPIAGAQAVASFTFDDIDVTAGPSRRIRIDERFPAGNYQLLGFLDIDGNADPADVKPDVGDPVFIPIGGFALECATQNVTAEFALTLPEGQGG
jgi:hypothetical protein